jgi:hypothetical protein
LTTNARTINDEPAIKKLLSRMPASVAESFNEEPLTHLLTALGARRWGNHALDLRSTFKVPFYAWRFYCVVLAGKNNRELSRKEIHISRLMRLLISTIFLSICIVVGLLVSYLLKSAAGIDLFLGFPLGIWAWFKGLWA